LTTATITFLAIKVESQESKIASFWEWFIVGGTGPFLIAPLEPEVSNLACLF
jgi:hypothetical protein